MASKTFVARPDRVLVGNHDYDIVWLTMDEWDARHLNDAADAVTYATQQFIAIRLRGEPRESFFQEILLHEMQHAIWDQTMLTHQDLSIHKDPDAEEVIVSLTSPPLLQLFKDNPEVVKYLMSDGTARR